jgi:hypothetical protein
MTWADCAIFKAAGGVDENLLLALDSRSCVESRNICLGLLEVASAERMMYIKPQEGREWLRASHRPVQFTEAAEHGPLPRSPTLGARVYHNVSLTHSALLSHHACLPSFPIAQASTLL